MKEREKTYEEEIDLTDILFYCVKKWRWIVSVMLIIAILVGGYKCYSVRRDNQFALQQWNGMRTEEEDASDLDVLQYYQSAIEENAEALQLQKDYLENSLVMQLDANHLQKGTLSYVVRLEDEDQQIGRQDVLIAAYKAYVTDGRLARLLYTQDEDIELSDLGYLITFPDLTSGTTININQFEPGQDVFQIQIVSADADSCEKYMETAIQEIQSYSMELQEQVGDHELELLGASVSESQDQAIRDYQIKVLNDYKTMVQGLNILQTEARTYAEKAEAAGAVTDELSGPVLTSPIQAGVKYGVLGLVLGAFLAVVALVVRYLLSDRLRNTTNFESKYGMRLLGRLVVSDKGKRIFGFLDRWLLQLGEGAYANLSYEEQTRIVSANVKAAIQKNVEDTRIMVAGSIASKDAADICDAFGKEIKGVTFSSYRQLVFDASALEELGDCDGILFIEKKDVSSARLICQECKIASDRDVKVLGAVVV